MTDADIAFGFDFAPIGLAVTRHRIIEICNPPFSEMFGYPQGTLPGKSIALLYPSNREFVDVGRLGLKAMTDEGHYGDERIMQRADGEQFWCAVRGRSTTKNDPFARCVWSFVDISEQRPIVNFTRREREIAMLAVAGHTNKQIARDLGISHRTVEGHRSRMMDKLGVTTGAELIAKLAGLPL